METQGWKWVSARVTGTSHLSGNKGCQDAYRCKTIDTRSGLYIVAIVCDGAGSSTFGSEGAEFVSRTLIRIVERTLKRGVKLGEVSETSLVNWVKGIKSGISYLAKKRGALDREFACTLTLIVSNGGESLIFQIGDSVCAVQSNDTWKIPIWPQKGEFASSTYFVSDNPFPKYEFKSVKYSISKFALFSDWVEQLALWHSRKKIHAPFFNSISQPLDHIKTCGWNKELSKKLEEFLKSELVCDRTEDDKTIVLAYQPRTST